MKKEKAHFGSLCSACSLLHISFYLDAPAGRTAVKRKRLAIRNGGCNCDACGGDGKPGAYGYS